MFIRAKISDTQKGRDIQTLLKDGVLNELSIGYDAVDFYYDGGSEYGSGAELYPSGSVSPSINFGILTTLIPLIMVHLRIHK